MWKAYSKATSDEKFFTYEPSARDLVTHFPKDDLELPKGDNLKDEHDSFLELMDKFEVTEIKVIQNL